MNPLVLDRLWPMLVFLGLLLAGALALETFAARRGNDPLVISIAGDEVTLDDDDASASAATAADAPVSDAHARARRAARRGEQAEALKLYEAALAASPGAAVLEEELGAVLLAAGDAAKALPHLERAEQLDPGAQRALRVGLARARLGDLEGAERDLRRSLERRPTGDARVALGNVLRRRGDPVSAIALLEPAVASGSNEDRARALVALGAAELAAGRREYAELRFSKAVEYAPARVEILLGVARAWLATGTAPDVRRAVQVLLRAADLAPDVAAVHALLGRAHERADEPGAALEDYDRTLRLDPTHRYARRRLLRLALQARDFARARHEADRLVADRAEEPEHHFLVALVADRDDRDDDARRAYRKAIAVARGDYPEAYLNLGALEKRAGDVAAARAAYGEALRLRPDYGAAWLNLGKLEEAGGDPGAAEAAYRKALALDAKYAAAWLALGQLQSAAGRFEEARSSLGRALVARPGYDAAQLSLGVAAARAGRPDEAIAAYQALLARSPRNVSAWYDLALVLEAVSRRDEARAALARALAIDPGHAPSLRTVAQLHLDSGRLAEARKAFEELLDLVPGDLEGRAALAEISAREGNRAACDAAARRLLAEAPQDPRVQTLPARCAGPPARTVSAP
ncbi:tetratricopeptide repeat protein [Anaeromyxobacter sp. Fw109-5]|uniref:tetratricopeptide repeat protein n=1 Tax=Anaeromyxobacter sp. (strain Fw109-5) TaxID=404589 RepID=UPI0000ED70C2|nr:tetratricopeptide repeat protein [Anaeromyxobacter sp. Fw109-5]ABS27660.1 Tetratricopeptide TPR_2 repeat protein [Anaeromyxobacter sp. Fw109-5]